MANIACTLPSFLQHALPPTSMKPCSFLWHKGSLCSIWWWHHTVCNI